MRGTNIFMTCLLITVVAFVPSCALGRNNVANVGSSGAYIGNVHQPSVGNAIVPTNTLGGTENPTPHAVTDASLTPSEKWYKNELIKHYQNALPVQSGEKTTGVLTHMNTTDKAIALTFDACGGKGGNGYDEKLIHYLMQEHIPATMFINSRWIDETYWTFMALAKNPLFEIENHGYLHRPLSINGKSAWGILGTENVGVQCRL